MLEILNHINPSQCDYEEWLTVGMAIKHEGGTAADWESWSTADERYNAGECFSKWQSFRTPTNPVTAGSLFHLAKSQGWSPQKDHKDLDADNIILSADDDSDYVFVDKNWLPAENELQEPDDWKPEKEIIKYFETLFKPDENIGYVVETWEKDGKFLPKKGIFNRTQKELVSLLKKCKGDIGAVFGDYNEAHGVWVRFNPLDGKGVRDENVTDLRYALVESDTLELSNQLSIIQELELPVACLVHSANKSIHAIVKIDAANYDEYRNRVDFLYKICKKNGLEIDKQNRNPSRLSRLPGVLRNGKKQYLINTNVGKANWQEWEDWIEELNDNLPDIQNLDNDLKNMPDLSPVLINGILRQGHKMLLSGPSKAGKSFDLLELSAAISSGSIWHSYQCEAGKVLYVNLEIEAASCIHRAKTIFDKLGNGKYNAKNIDFWHLRGRQISMDKLAPKLIRRATNKKYIAIIIDPIYKVITGDENSAEQMAKFFNHFDNICRQLNTALIYCHHHSKGEQGGKKSMDRSSGSGVFARDPDAVIDYIELQIDDDRRKAIQNNKEVEVFTDLLNTKLKANWSDDIPLDDQFLGGKLFEFAQKNDLGAEARELRVEIVESVKNISAWRMSGNVREFAPINDRKFYFDYPIHTEDKADLLKDAKAAGEEPPWKAQQSQKIKQRNERKGNQEKEMNDLYDLIGENNQAVTVMKMADHLGVSETSVRNRLKRMKTYEYKNGLVYRKDTK